MKQQFCFCADLQSFIFFCKYPSQNASPSLFIVEGCEENINLKISI